eukprot:5858857-Prymnesium_polylepis.1
MGEQRVASGVTARAAWRGERGACAPARGAEQADERHEERQRHRHAQQRHEREDDRILTPTAKQWRQSGGIAQRGEL